MSELLDCPFCGGVAETDSQRAYRALVSGHIGKAVAVYCTGPCGADMSLCLEDVPGLSAEDALAHLVDGWNKRGFGALPKLSPQGNPCLHYPDGCLRAADGTECFPCDHGAEPKCGCRETYPQLQPGRVNHGPGCSAHEPLADQHVAFTLKWIREMLTAYEGMGCTAVDARNVSIADWRMLLSLVERGAAQPPPLEQECQRCHCMEKAQAGGEIGVMNFTHWSKDPLVPYAGCICSSCVDARKPVEVDCSGSTK